MSIILLINKKIFKYVFFIIFLSQEGFGSGPSILDDAPSGSLSRSHWVPGCSGHRAATSTVWAVPWQESGFLCVVLGLSGRFCRFGTWYVKYFLHLFISYFAFTTLCMVFLLQKFSFAGFLILKWGVCFILPIQGFKSRVSIIRSLHSRGLESVDTDSGYNYRDIFQ